jgi:hypothetical protein
VIPALGKRAKRVSSAPARLRPITHRITTREEVASARITISGQSGTSLLLDAGQIAPRRQHRHVARLPRETWVDMVFPRPMILDSFKAGLAGEVLILDQFGVAVHPAKSTVSVVHRRPNGKDKVMVRYFLGTELPLVDMTRFLERFSVLYAVDTNTITTGNRRRHVSGVVRARLLRRLGKDLVSHVESVGTFEFQSEANDPEERGWSAALAHIAHGEKIPDDAHIGLVVDSHLGRLEKINNGEEPYFEDKLLPAHTELIFASDSAGSEEYLPCQLIRLADNLARQRLQEIVRNGAPGTAT